MKNKCKKCLLKILAKRAQIRAIEKTDVKRILVLDAEF